MGTNFTDMATTEMLIAATINDRLDELDAAIGGGETLTNKSGGALAANDCVVIDSGNDEAVTTTTTAGDTNGPAIVVDGGADNTEVQVKRIGEVTVVVDGAATRGQFFKTSTTAKQVTPVSTPEPGVFGMFTSASSGGAGTTATAMLFGLLADHDHAAGDIISGLLALARGGTNADLSATGGSGQYLKQAGAGAAVTVGVIAAGDLPSAIDATKIGNGDVDNTELSYVDGVTSAIQTQIDGKASTSHKDQHKSGGDDAFSVSDLLDAVARVQVKRLGTTVGIRRGINLIPGSDIGISVTDVPGDEHADVTINYTGGGGGGGGGAVITNIADGRLTLTTGTPVTTSDVTAATTLYYTPYTGNQIALYDTGGAAWALFEFSELSLSVPASTDTNYDLFAYEDAGGNVALETVAWSGATTRATALTRQDGVLVKSGDASRRYLGTFRTTGVSGQCEDSAAKRFVWNFYHRDRRLLEKFETTASWTYSGATWRPYNNSTANRVEFVQGIDQVVRIVAGGYVYNPSAAVGRIGVDLDGTTTFEAHQINGPNQFGMAIGFYRAWPGVGYHYVQAIESGNTGPVTFYGLGVGFDQGGIQGELLG